MSDEASPRKLSTTGAPPPPPRQTLPHLAFLRPERAALVLTGSLSIIAFGVSSWCSIALFVVCDRFQNSGVWMVCMYVCIHSHHLHCSRVWTNRVKVANPARGQVTREKLCPFAPENLISRNRVDRLVLHRPAQSPYSG